MVLCNQFRHPAVLAKMATTLDQISAGRLQLGIGSGSIEDEHNRTGLDWATFGERSGRLGETLEILHQAFANEVIAQYRSLSALDVLNSRRVRMPQSTSAST